MSSLGAVGYEGLVPMETPSWIHTEKTAQITGIALIVLGSIGVVITAALTLPISGGVLIASSIAGLAASIGSVISGIFLLRKENWNDPKWVAKVADKTKEMPLDAIVKNYGWEQTAKYHFISKKQLSEKLIQKINTENLTYSAVLEQYKDPLKKKVFDNRVLNPLLMKEIETDHLSLKRFKERFGIQPILDGVIDVNDPWIQNSLKAEVRGKNYQYLKRYYEGIISTAQIKTELMAQLTEKGFDRFFRDNREGFYLLLTENILTAENLIPHAADACVNKSVKEILDLYGWPIFTHSILKGSQYNAKFLIEVRDLPLSTVIRTYGYRILSCGIATKEQLRDKTQECAQWRFDQIIDTYGWEVFSYKVLTGIDVRNAFLEKAKLEPFCPFWKKYKVAVEKYELFSPEVFLFAKELESRKEQAEGVYNYEISNREQECSRKKSEAKNRAQQAKDQADLFVKRAERDYQLEMNKGERANGGLLLTLRTQYLNAKEVRLAAYGQAEANYIRLCDEANRLLSSQKEMARQKLTQELEEINLSFRVNLSGTNIAEIEVEEVKEWIEKRENQALCQLRIAKFIREFDKYIPLVLNSPTLLEYMANHLQQEFAPIVERVLRQPLTPIQKAALIPYMKPSDIKRFIDGVSRETQDLWLNKRFRYDNQNRKPLEALQNAYLEQPRSREHKDLFCMEVSDNLLTKISNGALAILAKQAHNLLLPFIPTMHDAQLAAVLPQLDTEVILPILQSISSTQRQIYLIQRAPLELKKTFLQQLPACLESYRKNIDEAEYILRSPRNQLIEQRILVLKNRAQAIEQDEERFGKLLDSFTKGDVDPVLTQLLEQKRLKKREVEQKLHTLLEQISRIQVAEVPAQFEDPLTGEVMNEPMKLPPYESDTRIDRTTLMNPRYCPTKYEGGHLFIKNPFTTLYYPAHEYVPDLELKRELQDYLNGRQNIV